MKQPAIMRRNPDQTRTVSEHVKRSAFHEFGDLGLCGRANL